MRHALEARRAHDGRIFVQALALGMFLAASYAAALVGSYFTAQGLSPWYADLAKPSWTPPGGVIGAVWSMLYALMGIAAWLVWIRGGLRANALPLSLFALQLVLNAAWSAIFFAWRAPGPALAEIMVLDAMVIATLVAFWRVRVAAGALMIPYVAWLAFATVLNAAIWRLNM